MPHAANFSELNYDNRFVNELPADPVRENHCRQVNDAYYSHVQPQQVRDAQLVAYSPELMESLGLDANYARNKEFTQIMAGNQLAPGMDPYAMCYGGHQFGHWAGQLGDGRAINLGEIVNAEKQRWALQLKGAGPTPYSRQADGFAVLRSSVREFLCSESMHHLGVPTTRALSLVTTGEAIRRDMFYDGNAKDEPGAIVCRVAPSFTRFGNFQLVSARNNPELLKQLIDFTIRTDFPHLGEINNQTIAQWFTEICARTAEMIAHWMRVGFVHGVMNTDNMSILGLTIDYGPYGWLDNYDPDWTPNTTDAQNRRYRYGNQPSVAHWNLVQLARSIVVATEDPEALQIALQTYVEHFEAVWSKMLLAKLGINEASDDNNQALREDCLQLLQAVETDMSLFFRALADIPLDTNLQDEQLIAPLSDAYYQKFPSSHRKLTANWLRELISAWNKSDTSEVERIELMNANNPLYVLRNYQAQLAIDDAEKGDYDRIHTLQNLLKNPYQVQAGMQAYAQKRPDWARSKPGCSMLSCSS